MVLKTVKYNYDFNDKKPKEDRYFQANPKKKGLQEFYRNLSEDDKLIKEIILTIEIKILQM